MPVGPNISPIPPPPSNATTGVPANAACRHTSGKASRRAVCRNASAAARHGVRSATDGRSVTGRPRRSISALTTGHRGSAQPPNQENAALPGQRRSYSAAASTKRSRPLRTVPIPAPTTTPRSSAPPNSWRSSAIRSGGTAGASSTNSGTTSGHSPPSRSASSRAVACDPAIQRSVDWARGIGPDSQCRSSATSTDQVTIGPGQSISGRLWHAATDTNRLASTGARPDVRFRSAATRSGGGASWSHGS